MPYVTSKKVALLVTLLLVAGFAAPGVRHLLPRKYLAEDSFPISTFTMFSRARPELHRMTWVRALDKRRKPMGHIQTRVFNPSGMNQTMAHLRRARRRNRKVRRDMCEQIAGRVARKRSLRKVARVQIVDAYYRPEEVFGKNPSDEAARLRVLVTCRVRRAKREKDKQ